MSEPLQIRTLGQLRMVIESGSGLVVTDTAGPPKFHPDPAGCPQVTESASGTKVNDDGTYFVAGSFLDARSSWPLVTACRVCPTAVAPGAAISRKSFATPAALHECGLGQSRRSGSRQSRMDGHRPSGSPSASAMAGSSSAPGRAS